VGEPGSSLAHGRRAGWDHHFEGAIIRAVGCHPGDLAVNPIKPRGHLGRIVINAVRGIVARVDEWVALSPTDLHSTDADGDRASELQHPVQDMNGNADLGCPTATLARAQPVTDHLLAAPDAAATRGGRPNGPKTSGSVLLAMFEIFSIGPRSRL
jgi:hypothetical protein